MNDPLTAWVLQVYLRDKGLYMALKPSNWIYGGFTASIEQYDLMRGGYVRLAEVHSNTVQDAAFQCAEQVADISDFETWRTAWESR